MDVAIPIVFPDYRIAVELEPTPVDLLPWFTFDNFKIPEYQDRWSGLGHAGVFFVNGRTGLTKYYGKRSTDPIWSGHASAGTAAACADDTRHDNESN